MIRVRASQVFTHSLEDSVAAKKALDANTPFDKVVEEYSTCPSKKQGGDLGWMPEEAALSLMGESVTENDKGKLIGPVHSEYGYHILTITDVEKVEMVSTPGTANVVPPEELHQLLDASRSSNMTILDIREEWEWNISKIKGSQLVTRENCESILSALDKNQELVLIDWRQERSPSFQNWLLQRGFSCVKCLEGGIDAWADKIDPSLPRYEIDEDDGYRYEDILEENDHDH